MQRNGENQYCIVILAIMKSSLNESERNLGGIFPKSVVNEI